MSKEFCIVHLKDGIVQNRKPVTILFQSLKDGKYLLEVSKADKRTNPQNRYYWQMLTLFVQPALYQQGWAEIKTKEDAHVFVSEIFLKVKIVNQVTGEIKERIKSTTELNKDDFNIYLEEIWRWAAEYLSITIPAPNEQTILSYGN